MVDTLRPRFKLGQVVATPGAIETLRKARLMPQQFLDRHIKGDWGDLSADDKTLNDDALVDGSRIMSAYTLTSGEKLWVITEAADDDGNRICTTLLLPDEY